MFSFGTLSSGQRGSFVDGGIPIWSLFSDDQEVVVSGLYGPSKNLGIPICSLFHDDIDDDMNVYGTSGTSGKVDWDSWDKFIQLLVKNSLFVKKKGSICPTLMKYRGGFIVLRGIIRKRVVCVKGINCCTCIDDTIVIETKEIGSVRITFKSECDALAVARVLSGFACGRYDIGLP